MKSIVVSECQPIIAAVTEYEVAMNSSVSGEQKTWARTASGCLQISVRRLKLLTVTQLARGSEESCMREGISNSEKGIFSVLTMW